MTSVNAPTRGIPATGEQPPPDVRGRHRPGLRARLTGAESPSPGLVAIVITVTWLAVLAESTLVPANPALHRVALFVHLACLIVGFGAVVAVDWIALKWLLRRCQLRQVLAVADQVHLLIWLGLAGMAASGGLLRPDLGATLTQIKLLLVLLVALNGVQATALHRRIAAFTGPVPRLLLLRSVLAALVSQGGWWGAMAIGFLSSHPA
ncbi:hypothetical protein GCM10009662_47960 [Catellatospora coxensis]|uniref:Uncharacterized protein n=1 Tax=Catellatospora coxensis TaxID=310354 RepID=A0A8J3L4L7_9ACTN|nr:hypothetical protein Cco03nite_31200 [Catellatospora coxensis]